MKISEVPSFAEETDYIFSINTFLDEFYHAEHSERAGLLADEPEKGILDERQYCSLAAAAHKLANDYNLPVPAWAMQEKYKMPYPVYAFNAEDKDDRELLRTVTPDEYKARNLYLGSKILKRV